MYPKLSRNIVSPYKKPSFASPIKVVTRCNEELEDIDRLTVELCENSELNYAIDSIIPVTYERKITYKNIFCARCNGYDKQADHSFWDLHAYCDQIIDFNAENFPYVIEEEKCDVYFKQPTDAETTTCIFIPSFKISSCNVTGLWKSYSWEIEAACNFFTDPFNQTYRNYFCYLCNTNQPKPFEHWSCEDPFSEQLSREPKYIFLFNIDAIKQIDASGMLNCDSKTQFPDLKLVRYTIQILMNFVMMNDSLL